MDPTEVLRRIKRDIDFIMKSGGASNVDDDSLDELISLVNSLDEWMTRGGFSPKQWTIYGGG